MDDEINGSILNTERDWQLQIFNIYLSILWNVMWKKSYISECISFNLFNNYAQYAYTI